MNPIISMDVALEALAALHDARKALANQDTTLAFKCATAEGRLRGALVSAIPSLELKPAA